MPTCPRCGSDKAPKIYEAGCEVCLGFLISTEPQHEEKTNGSSSTGGGGGLSVQEKTEFFEKSLGQLTVGECLVLINHLEREWDVEASPNLGVLPQPPGRNDQEAEEEQTAFDVILTDVGQTKIKVIRAVRQVTGQALKEASDSLKELPASIAKGVSKEDADKIKAGLVEASATVEVK